MIDPIVVQSWKHFSDIVDVIENLDASSVRYAYRGQSNAEWDLETSLYRYLKRSELTEIESLNIEALAMTEFKSQAHIHLSPSELVFTKDSIAWWSVMQHHGAPTRLLDWTSSAYVAAYFAVSGSLDKDGAFWLIHLNETRKRLDKKYGKVTNPKTEAEIVKKFINESSEPNVIFLGRKSKSSRMVSQQAFFSLSTLANCNHGDIFNSVFEVSEPAEYFRKLVIPSALKIEFTIRLRKMNVSASSLYPGLDGLGRSISEYVNVMVK